MIDQIRPTDVAAWFGTHPPSPSGAKPVLLDVREPWERQVASVRPEGFALVAIPMNEIPRRLSELDPDQPIACLCHHGARSQSVALFLQNNDFSKVANVAGGIDAWSLQQDPSVPRY
ncbi:Sulfurtransferase [Burkholderiales bacterium 8X]|nr:Sulfurtransferase [Burkholderiales bacterium 8X]